MEEFFDLVPYYIPEWEVSNERNQDDFGIVLSKIFANILEDVIVRLNRVPQMNFIEFLNTLGINLIAAQPARVPVKFNLSEKVTQNVEVPAGTEVATDSTDKHDVLTFGTKEKLVVTPAILSEIYSFANAIDAIYKHTQDYVDGKSFFVLAGKDDLQEHIFYLGDSKLFDIKSPKIKIALRLSLTPIHPVTDELKDFFKKNLLWEYNWNLDPTGRLYVTNVEEFPTKDGVIIDLKKRDENPIQQLKVNETESYWIRCRLDGKVSAGNEYFGLRDLNFMNNIEILISSSGDFLSPDHFSYNYMPLNKEPDEPILPFGKRPATFDAFYIASRDAFSKKLSELTLTFKAKPSENTLIRNNGYAQLSWEYWNGRDWASISGADSNPDNQTVTFTCPDDIQLVQVSGKENYWIRVRIVSGNYGDLNVVSTTVPNDDGSVVTTYELKTDNIIAPSLKYIKIKIDAAKTPNHPENCFTYNNLQFTSCIDEDDDDDDVVKLFQPFITLDDAHPTLYLGFDKKVEDGPIYLFFSLKEQRISQGLNKPKLDIFYYSNTGDQWSKIENEDGTEGITKTGTIKLFFPDNFGKQRMFGKNLFWLKIINTNDVFSTPAKEQAKLIVYNLLKHKDDVIFAPQIKAIYINTIYATHAAKINDEVLGSSTGLPYQKFKFAKAISGSSQVYVWVNEGKILDETEKRKLLEQKEIQEERDAQGNLIDTWVLWQRVDDIYAAGPQDRSYGLDAAFGTILFGDNNNGRIPPFGSNNIKSTYIAGGGSEGNINANEIKLLKTPIQFVDSVTNPEPAEGGLDVEIIEDALARGPNKFKNRGQPVTSEDFEWLVREKFPSLARVKCMPTTNSNGDFEPGCITIVVIPSSSEEKPIPSLELLYSIERYLSSLASIEVVSENQLKVISPLYVSVSVMADVYPVSIDVALDAEGKALTAIQKYFHPLFGGVDGKGWDFGSNVCPGDIYKLLENISEIDHISNMFFNFVIEYQVHPSGSREIPYRNSFTLADTDVISVAKDIIPPHSLIYSGDHKLNIKFLE